MSAGPLRRTTGAVGLVGLAPIAAMLVLGSLSPEQAALRSLAVLLAVLVVGNLAKWGLSVLAGRFERHGDTGTGAPGRDDAAAHTTEPPAGVHSGVHGGPMQASGLGRRSRDR